MLGKIDDDIRAEGGTASLIPLGFADGQAIDALGPSLHERFGSLMSWSGVPQSSVCRRRSRPLRQTIGTASSR